jgi:hypothetical protein
MPMPVVVTGEIFQKSIRLSALNFEAVTSSLKTYYNLDREQDLNEHFSLLFSSAFGRGFQSPKRAGQRSNNNSGRLPGATNPAKKDITAVGSRCNLERKSLQKHWFRPA